MLQTPYATLDDVTAIFGPVADQAAKVVRLLEFAAAIVRSKAPGMQGRLDDGTLEELLVVSVVTAMVARVLRNPLGHRQGSQGIDDYSTSWTVDQAVSTGALYVSDDEVLTLSPAATGDWAGSVSTGHRPAAALDTWR